MPYLYHFNYSIQFTHDIIIFPLVFTGTPGPFRSYVYIYIHVCMCGSRSKDNIERVGIYVIHYIYDITPIAIYIIYNVNIWE